MEKADEFIKWSRENSFGRGLLCHFYKDKSGQKYYTTTDYAYLNLFSNSSEWVFKGTTGHGVTSLRGKKSPIACLNCYEIDDEFYKGIKKLARNKKQAKYYAFGLILNKRALKRKLGRFAVIDVSPINKWDPLPSPSNCHRFDFRQDRYSLYPFNKCDVVRIVIKPDFLNAPMFAVPQKYIRGMIMRRGERIDVVKLLKSRKRWNLKNTDVFPLL